MDEQGTLVDWPLFSSPVFDRFVKPMFLQQATFDGGFTLLVGPANNRYEISYKRTDACFYPIRTHRILEEHVRDDVEQLIRQRIETLQANEQPLPTYNATVYKVEHSSFLRAYVTIDASISEMEREKLEHHLYICDDYFVDVIAATQPTVRRVMDDEM